MNCYCGSDRKFENCCQPFINGSARPRTAEELMRSRYAAYVTVEVDYLRRTTHPSTRKFYQPEALEQWAKSNRWQGLEIISTVDGQSTDKQGMVEFKAYYRDEDQQPQVHHERSSFLKELGKWFFVEGKIVDNS